MSDHIGKNYFEDGGDTLVIGGKLIIKEGASASGTFTPAGNVAASTASDVAGVVSDLNSLLEALKAAGLMEADEAGS